MTIIGIYRAERFSPASVEKDRLIMMDVLGILRTKGYDVVEMNEETIVEQPDILLQYANKESRILSMARSEIVLKAIDHRAIPSINSTDGIRMCCHRSRLDTVIRKAGIPCPPTEGDSGVWIKRGDASAEVADDIIFCPTPSDTDKAIRAFHDRGINDLVFHAHINGDLVKFYGVASTAFFYHYYPTEHGRSKFGLEEHNSEISHFVFDDGALRAAAEKVATMTGIMIYGGDAIVRKDGSFAIIDFNDWPSFSPCRHEAAKAIALLLNEE